MSAQNEITVLSRDETICRAADAFELGDLTEAEFREILAGCDCPPDEQERWIDYMQPEPSP